MNLAGSNQTILFEDLSGPQPNGTAVAFIGGPAANAAESVARTARLVPAGRPQARAPLFASVRQLAAPLAQFASMAQAALVAPSSLTGGDGITKTLPLSGLDAASNRSPAPLC